jgi:hypothetical protein
MPVLTMLVTLTLAYAFRESSEVQRRHRRAWASPAVGAYDMERAWTFLNTHVPAVIMALARNRYGLAS